MKKALVIAMVMLLSAASFAFVVRIIDKKGIPSREVSIEDLLKEGISILEPAKFSVQGAPPILKDANKIPPPSTLHKVKIAEEELIPKETQEWWDYVIREGFVNADSTMKYVPGEMVILMHEEARGIIEPSVKDGILHTGIASLDKLNQKYQAESMVRIIEDDLSGDELAIKHRLDLIYIITFPTQSDMQVLSLAYMDDPVVDEASPNYYPVPDNIPDPGEEMNPFNIPQENVPNDPNYDWAPEIVKSREAWYLEKGDNSYRLCHMAAGGRPNYAHTDLDLNWSGYAGNGGTAHNHATACCGCMVAETNNSSGMAGQAGGWGATEGVNFMYYNVTTSAAHITGLHWAVDSPRNAMAINHSFSWLAKGVNPAGLENGINYAWDNGAVIFCSAGNDPGSAFSYPAYYGNVIAVAASDASDKYTNWSTCGDWVDLAAPGASQYLIGYGGNGSGTSFSSPRACGLAGLMKSYNTGWNNVTIRDNIERTADWLDYLNPGKEGLYGGGRINAYEALMARDKNVSVNAILEPGDSISANFGISPEVVVQNRGKQAESFLITCEIDTMGGSNVYTCTRLVEDLLDSYHKIEKGRIVTFDEWTPGSGGAEYEIKVYSKLTGDQNFINDTLTDTIYVRTAAGGTLDTLTFDDNSPYWYFSDNNLYVALQFSPAMPCSIMTGIVYTYNSGSYSTNMYTWDDNSGMPGTIITGPTSFTPTHTSWYSVNIPGHPYTTTDFHLGFITNPGGQGGPYVMADNSTEAPTDNEYSTNGVSWSNYPNYDWCIRAVVKYPPPPANDVMTYAILVPDAHEITGVPIIPRAVVKNIGDNAQSGFNVTFKADSAGDNVLTSTKTIASLGPLAYDTLDFDGWTPNWEGGTYNCRVYTELSGDEDTSNDTMTVDVDCSSDDTLIFDDESPYWIYIDNNCNWAVTFYPQRSCSVMGIDYMLYSTEPAQQAKQITIYAYEAANDTPTTEIWSRTRSSTLMGWNTYTFIPSHKFDRPNAEDFALGIWTYGLQTPDTICPRLDNTAEPPYHTYANTGTGWGSPLAYDMMLRARIKYYGSLPDTEAAVVSFDNPLEYDIVHLDRSYTPTVTIKNNGTQPLANFNAICTFDTGAVNCYTDTVLVASLPVAYTQQVAFADWTPAILDADYTWTVWIEVPNDANSSNDTLSTEVYCRVVDVISYNDETWGSGIGDGYAAVRFTPERTCSLVGALINIYGANTPAWDQSCTLFCFKDTLTRPASLGYLDHERYVPTDVIGTPQNGYEYRIRIDFSSAKMSSVVCSTDFWLSNYTQANASAGSLYTTASDLTPTGPAGRSLTNSDRMDDSLWQAPIWLANGGADTVQGNWEIKALVRYYNWAGDKPQPPNVMVNNNDPHLSVWWNEVKFDVYGSPVLVDHYEYFRANSPDFIPGVTNWITAGGDTAYTDNFLYNNSNDYYYLAFAFDKYGTKSDKSNMGVKFNKTLYENDTKTDKNWVSLPYNSEYTNASDITNEFSPGGSPIYKITKRNPDQTYTSRVWIGFWSGDFAITEGAMYEISTDDTTIVKLCGSHDPTYAVQLNYNASVTDKNWISIPYNAIYANASDITDEFSPSGSPIYKITRRNPDQTYVSRVWIGFWSGDFALQSGEGLEISVDQDTNWTPSLYPNSGFGFPLAFNPKGSIQKTAAKSSSFVTPEWGIANSARDLIGKGTKKNAKTVEEGGSESHTLYGKTSAPSISSIKFITFLRDHPEKAMDESYLSSSFEIDEEVAYWVADIGNLPFGWRAEDEVITILGSEESSGKMSHRGYYAVMNTKLDGRIDPQECRSVAMELMPKPKASLIPEDGTIRVSWECLDDELVIGYSLYRSEDGIVFEDRLNNEIITDAEFIDEEIEYGERYYYALKIVYVGGYESPYLSGNSQAVEYKSSKYWEEVGTTPKVFGIRQNTPNPFGRQTEIRYQLPERTQVSLVIYDATGRQVTQLVSGVQDAGFYSITWDGTNSSGEEVGTNVYFYRITAGEFIATRKMNLVR